MKNYEEIIAKSGYGVTYEDIRGLDAINAVDRAHIDEIKDSIRTNGWCGAPILVAVVSGMLITGSHRLTALDELEAEGDVDVLALGLIAVDVQDIVDSWYEAHTEEDGDCKMFPYDCLGDVFRGTWIEQFADEIEEW